MRKNISADNALKAAAVLLIAVLAYLTVTMISIVSFSEKDETRKADAAIVLGASVYDNSPSPVFSERINHAAELFNSLSNRVDIRP
jgi:vancomycin permeability regulator SanA